AMRAPGPSSLVPRRLASRRRASRGRANPSPDGSGGSRRGRLVTAELTGPDQGERDLGAQVVGALILKPDLVHEVRDCGLEPDDIYWTEHADIFRVISSLHASGEAIDLKTVVDELVQRPPIPGRPYGPDALGRIADVVKDVPVAANAVSYATR